MLGSLKDHPIVVALALVAVVAGGINVLLAPFGRDTTSAATVLAVGLVFALALFALRGWKTESGAVRFGERARVAFLVGSAAAGVLTVGLAAWTYTAAGPRDAGAAAAGSTSSSPTPAASSSALADPATIADIRLGALAADPNGAAIDIAVAAGEDTVVASRLDVMQFLAVDDTGDEEEPGMMGCGGDMQMERLTVTPATQLVKREDGSVVVGSQKASDSSAIVEVQGLAELTDCSATSIITLEPQQGLEPGTVGHLQLELPSDLEVLSSRASLPASEDPLKDTQALLEEVGSGMDPQVRAGLESRLPGKTFRAFLWPWQQDYSPEVMQGWDLVMVVAVSLSNGECLRYGADLEEPGTSLTAAQVDALVDNAEDRLGPTGICGTVSEDD
jgi:hypothetical protein